MWSHKVKQCFCPDLSGSFEEHKGSSVLWVFPPYHTHLLWSWICVLGLWLCLSTSISLPPPPVLYLQTCNSIINTYVMACKNHSLCYFCNALKDNTYKHVAFAICGTFQSEMVFTRDIFKLQAPQKTTVWENLYSRFYSSVAFYQEAAGHSFRALKPSAIVFMSLETLPHINSIISHTYIILKVIINQTYHIAVCNGTVAEVIVAE